MTTPDERPSVPGQAIEPVLPEPAAQPQQQFLLALGALQVTNTHIHTPLGALPLAQTNVTVIDQTRSTTKIPAWAIIMTVVAVWFFLLGLLFLLAKETQTAGYVSITVQHRDGRSYTEHVAISSAYQRDVVVAQAHWMQQAASSATWQRGYQD